MFLYPFTQEFECTVKLIEVSLQTGPLEKAKQFLNILLDLEKYLKTPGIYVLKDDATCISIEIV